MEAKALAQQILEYLGGAENILELENCMTRLRVRVRDSGKVNKDALSKVKGVMGVVGSPEEPQVILGPGVADRICAELKQVDGLNYSEAKQDNALMHKKKSTGIFEFFSNVFVPLVSIFAGAGLLFGVKQIFVLVFSLTGTAAFNPAPVADGGSVFMAALTVLSSTFFTYLNIAVGCQAAKVMGGNPYLGLIAGGIVTNVGNLAGASMGFFGLTFTNGKGGTLAALAAGALIAVVEKKIKSHCPDSLQIHLPSLGAIVVVGLATLFIIQPVCGILTTGITNVLLWLVNNAGPLGGAVIAFSFLPLVMTGMHQGLTPVHLSLIQQLGYTPIYGFDSMAGGGQVGAALALFFKYRKNKSLRVAVKGGLPAGILGIGEPLIFGVSLPLGRVFFLACAGAALGGAVLGFFPNSGPVTVSVSGILGVLVNTNPLVYLLGYAVSIVGGFLFTWFIGAKKETLDTFGGDL